MTLRRELSVARASLEMFVGGFDAATPQELAGQLALITRAVSDIGALVERMERLKMGYSVPLETLDQITQQMGITLVRIAQERISDDDTRTALLNAVESAWGRIQPSSGYRT